MNIWREINQYGSCEKMVPAGVNLHQVMSILRKTSKVTKMLQKCGPNVRMHGGNRKSESKVCPV